MKTCPVCRKISVDSAWSCDCGFSFTGVAVGEAQSRTPVVLSKWYIFKEGLIAVAGGLGFILGVIGFVLWIIGYSFNTCDICSTHWHVKKYREVNNYSATHTLCKPCATSHYKL